MTRNCYNVMRKLAADYRDTWFKRYGYTDAEKTKYWNKLPSFSHPSLERYVHNKIQEDRRNSMSMATQQIVSAGKQRYDARMAAQPQAPTHPQAPAQPYWTVDGGWRDDMKPAAPQQDSQNNIGSTTAFR